MKILKLHKAVILVFMLVAFLSCKDDNNHINLNNDLIGEWQRSDINNEFEYKLLFNSNNTGVRTQREGALDGQAISSAVMFNWTTNENVLNLDFDGEITTTIFSINANGELFLSDITNLYFIKLD